jgi:hypothetical protein
MNPDALSSATSVCSPTELNRLDRTLLTRGELSRHASLLPYSPAPRLHGPNAPSYTFCFGCACA